MRTRIAISLRKAAFLMLDAGLTLEQTQHGIKTILQPSPGYIYGSDLQAFISQTNKPTTKEEGRAC